MSDINNLEFDDDIDFDGLDEASVGENENADAEKSDDDLKDVSNFSEIPEEDISDNSPEIVVTNVETTISDDNCFENESENEMSKTSDDVLNPAVTKSDKFLKSVCITNAVISVLTLCGLVAGISVSYKYISDIGNDIEEKNIKIAELEDKNSKLEMDYIEAVNMYETESTNGNNILISEIEQGKIIHYDTYVGYSWMPVLAGVEHNTYKPTDFLVDDRYRMSYVTDGEESSYFGIDVSSYQGEIDWQLVKEDGVEFAFLRIGFRGYGEEGKLCADEFFTRNYEKAKDAGIDLGIYFFSQAITVDEAVEEAEFVLSLLEDRTLEYPIAFDWETVDTGDPEDIPRTVDVMPNTLTLSAIAFCETVKDAGYDAMIYTNKKLATIKYDLRQLSEYPVWLAYYNTELDYCYDFDIWQYGTALVDGIEGEVDVNVAIIN